MNTTNPSPKASALLTFCIVAGSSVLFCSKGVVVKLSYTHGVDALTVLALRMGFALPLFAAIALIASRKAAPLSGSLWLRLAVLGFLGYYLSSLVNFIGLQYVSVGLERIILYTYPSLVLAITALVLRKRVRPAVWLACAVAWAGILAAFAGEMHHPAASERTLFGATLIFVSALSYAGFIAFSGHTIRELGPMRFTGIVAGLSCVFILAHYAAMRPFDALLHLPPAVYKEGLYLAVFGTVVPAALLGIGLKRAGAQKFAVISTIGPVTTLFLAWAILGEEPNVAQGLGFFLTLAGGLGISLLKDSAKEQPQAPAAASDSR